MPIYKPYRKQEKFVKSKSYALFNTINPKDIQKLVENGDDVNIVDNMGNTPLHKMVVKRQIDAIKKLLEMGANPNIRNGFGQTPLHLIKTINMDEKDKDIVKILLNMRASPYIRDNKNNIPFITNSVVKEIVNKKFIN